eukprot:ANDGO_06726.mRNA.1 hypothetical protein
MDKYLGYSIVILSTLIPSLVGRYYFSTLSEIAVADASFAFYRWHPLLMSIGCCLMLPLAFLSFRRIVSTEASAAASNMPYATRKNIHASLQIGAVSCVGAALYVIYALKDAANPDDSRHFSTPHGILGAAVVVLLGMQAVGGLLSFTIASKPPPAFNRAAHRVLGTVTTIAAIANVGVGIGVSMSKRRDAGLDTTEGDTVQAATAVLTALVLLAAFRLPRFSAAVPGSSAKSNSLKKNHDVNYRSGFFFFPSCSSINFQLHRASNQNLLAS